MTGDRPYAAHGSDAFNQWMEERTRAVVADVRAALGDNLVALAIGGGYARGEGGVVLVDGEERPYNDLDFTIVVRTKDASVAPALEEVSRKHHPIFGIDVDFSRPLTIADIRGWPHWLMWTDLLAGHRIVAGDENALLANAPPHLRDSPPLVEATRLLLNRGAGLLWSRRILAGCEDAPDADFLRRNVHKAEIAINDTVMMALAKHRTMYAGRAELLESLLDEAPDARAFADPALYREALAFRLEPDRAATDQPDDAAVRSRAVRWGEALLFVERRRLDHPFPTVEEYASWPGVREPSLHTPAERLKNIVRNRRLGRSGMRHPREGLYRALPGLLRGGTDAAWQQESAEFLRIWKAAN